MRIKIMPTNKQLPNKKGAVVSVDGVLYECSEPGTKQGPDNKAFVALWVRKSDGKIMQPALGNPDEVAWFVPFAQR